MGSMNAMAFAEAVEDGQLSLNAALVWHLRSNHYPPIPLSMLGTAERAIELVNDDEGDELVELPEGVESRRHGKSVPAWDVIEELHLQAFLDGGHV